ncbi:Alkaline phosphatase, tissue-nonspecific isozyme [Halotydeus destructor]|nr:Alkaline phosphatase, tissue-nonspecific isozyme [Halotydeus destructor]
MLQLVTLLTTAVLIASSSKVPLQQAEKTTQFWYNHGINEIKEAMEVKVRHHKAKNVILFLGDGMSITTLTAARILKGQLKGESGEEGQLYFETFPHTSLIKTYNIDRQVPDSAGTATAFLCGVKANYETIGVNAHISAADTDCSAIKQHSVPSILDWATKAGKSAGVVTTTRITHATPAASYAHAATRYWENDGKLHPDLDPACKDIARQLVEDAPGNKLKVILGGGRRHFLPTTEQDPRGEKAGDRTDGRNLIEDWKRAKLELTGREERFRFVNSTAQLKNINVNKVDYLLGLFNHDHVTYDTERDTSGLGEPSLDEMVVAAIKMLSKDKNGFVLLVEGGRIDHAHHDNFGKRALLETIAFDKAIQTAREMLPHDETLLVVTADHAHTLTINGYPARGQSIFGFSDLKETNTNMQFTTLMYGNGPGHHSPRIDPLTQQTDALEYRHSSGVHLVDSAHGGEDVALYSTGPMAHLFHSLHEQPYVAHVIAYAACIGNFKHEAHCIQASSASSYHKLSVPWLLSVALATKGLVGRPHI